MWSIDATRQKERLFLLTLQLFTDVLRDQPVASVLLVGGVERGPVSLYVLPGATSREADGTLFRIQRAG